MNTLNTSDASTRGPARGRHPLIVLAAAVLAGVLAWLVGETSLVQARPRTIAMSVMGFRMNATTIETEQNARRATAARSYGVLGAALGLSLGAAGCLVGRARPARWPIAVVVALLAGADGYFSAFLGVSLFNRYRDVLEMDIAASMVLHAAIWCALAGVAGLSFGLGAGGDRRLIARCVVGAVVGALVGTALYETLGAVLFATDETGEPVSASAGSRLLARLLVAVSTGAGVVLVGEARPRGQEGPRPEGRAEPGRAPEGPVSTS